MIPSYYIGTSGWHYNHWRYRFYSRELDKAKWLEFYAGHFDTVELNNGFIGCLGEPHNIMAT